MDGIQAPARVCVYSDYLQAGRGGAVRVFVPRDGEATRRAASSATSAATGAPSAVIAERPRAQRLARLQAARDVYGRRDREAMLAAQLKLVFPRMLLRARLQARIAAASDVVVPLVCLLPPGGGSGRRDGARVGGGEATVSDGGGGGGGPWFDSEQCTVVAFGGPGDWSRGIAQMVVRRELAYAEAVFLCLVHPLPLVVGRMW